jgi:type II secretory pathway component GspD/PulD (secretin)
MTQKPIIRTYESWRLMFAAVLLALTTLVWAQQPAATLNWKDADIRQVVEAVSAVTGKNFIPVDSPGTWLCGR